MVEEHTLLFLRYLQSVFSSMIKEEHLKIENVKEVCAVDVAYNGKTGFAVASRGSFQEVVQHKVFSGAVDFPYISGYLFMREAPIMLKALEGFQCDLLLVDGHGTAHPRRSGIAVVLGVLLNLPTIGIAKSRLTGEILQDGGVNYVVVNGKKEGVKSGKYYYSIGNKVDLEDCVYVSKMGYPGVLKETDRLTKKYKKGDNESSKE